MGRISGMVPIFEIGISMCFGSQPTESYGKSMDFGLVFARFRGLNAMCGYVCVNEQSKGRVCAFSRKVLIHLCCSSDARGSEIAMSAEEAKSYPGNLIQIIGDGGVTKPSILRRYAEFSIIYFCESKIPCLRGCNLKLHRNND